MGRLTQALDDVPVGSRRARVTDVLLDRPARRTHRRWPDDNPAARVAVALGDDAVAWERAAAFGEVSREPSRARILAVLQHGLLQRPRFRRTQRSSFARWTPVLLSPILIGGASLEEEQRDVWTTQLAARVLTTARDRNIAVGWGDHDGDVDRWLPVAARQVADDLASAPVDVPDDDDERSDVASPE